MRRVATLVAEGPAPTAVFDAVIAEVGQLLGGAQIGLARYENEHEISVLAIRGQSPEILRAGMRLPLDDDSVNARILRTGRSARLNFAEEGSGSVAEILRRDNVNATVGAPIVVDGAPWGMIGASWRGDDQPPSDAEERLAQFADLLATAVSNAAMRTELAASRARVIAAADESRRRIERDLHDGAQQQLVTLAVALRRAQARIPSALDEVRADVGRVADGLTGAVNELRDLSRGIHPAILAEGGLLPALKALGRRSDVPGQAGRGLRARSSTWSSSACATSPASCGRGSAGGAGRRRPRQQFARLVVSVRWSPAREHLAPFGPGLLPSAAHRLQPVGYEIVALFVFTWTGAAIVQRDGAA